MQPFMKIIRPLTTPTRRGNFVSVFCKVQYDAEGKLSFTGVEGPYANGNAYGSCGQIDLLACDVSAYTPGWNAKKVAKFAALWKDWRLNDMRPYSPEMKAAGWHALARTPMYGFHFTLRDDRRKEKATLEKSILDCARTGGAFTPSKTQVELLNAPFNKTIWREIDTGVFIRPPGMELAKHTCGTMKAPERKTLGWLRQSEHPNGLLGARLNPDDPYGYGGKWWFESVPEKVLEWLLALPDTDVQPTWV